MWLGILPCAADGHIPGNVAEVIAGILHKFAPGDYYKKMDFLELVGFSQRKIAIRSGRGDENHRVIQPPPSTRSSR